MPSSSLFFGPPEMVVKNRFLGFLIWQSIPSTFVFFLFKIFVSAIFSVSGSNSSSGTSNPSAPFASMFTGFFTFLTFHLSQLLFSASLSLLASPQLERPAAPLELTFGLVRFLVVSGGDNASSTSAFNDFRRRATVSLYLLLFVVATAISGSLAAVSICWGKSDGLRSAWHTGLSMGLIYGAFYVYNKRWVLTFPIIQRPPFFSFKMGFPAATRLASKLSAAAFLFSAVLMVLLPDQFKRNVTVRKFIANQAIIFVGSFAIFLSWELTQHLHQVLHTKRYAFAPPKGSAAAETNPSEYLFAALEDSNSGSLLQYLAFLDLCMVCENNVDIWRRAAFFEETGETYKRIISISLKPLEQFALNLGQGLEGAVDITSQLSPKDSHFNVKQFETLKNFQLYAWCARTVSMLTARSHAEDRFGVAQLSGSNATVMSTLLSCLLAVEVLMGKKTTIQSSHGLFGPASIKWATSSIGRVDASVGKRKSGPLHSKAYAIANVLRVSIYVVVSAFHNEMVNSAKSGVLEKDWITSEKPLYGTRELLLQKLHIFLDFQA
ncbi:uncharacterized protein LOC111781279 isoform X1 [Cucurbita pepo subsp. pepo]|uniref:uncharacterized protein LOC111781279 isoform X1 n=2 Tax=Cucurbita pepo subsp. pepo TaxID=3664 RepID=UPI000C9D4402|nr:uncharacterized protein LOC111781279 isoform X1 [Cucurbita pepo subsp. pepo]